MCLIVASLRGTSTRYILSVSLTHAQLAHHGPSLMPQQWVVWSLRLYGGSEGPALVQHGC